MICSSIFFRNLSSSYPFSFTVLVFLLLWLYGGGCYQVHGASFNLFQEEIVPDREIHQQTGIIPSWQYLWRQARQLVRSGEYNRAVLKYEKLMAEKNDLEEARWELAKLKLHLKKYDKAIILLELLLEIRPGHFNYLKTLALVMEKTNQVERAVGVFTKAHKQQPDNLAPLQGIIRGLTEVGKKKESLPFLERLYLGNLNDIKIRKQLVELYYELALYDDARPHLVDLLQDQNIYGSTQIDLLLMAAQTHEQLGLDNLAVDYWKQLFLLNANNHTARERIARFYEKLGLGEKTLQYLRPLLQSNPDDPVLLKRVGEAHTGMSQFAKALPYFEKYIELRPNSEEVLQHIIDIHAALGQDTEALATLTHFLAIKPAPAPVNLQQAAALYKSSGHYQEAVILYRRLLTLTPDDPEVLANLAEVLFAAGKEESVNLLWQQFAGNPNLRKALEIMYLRQPTDERVALQLAAIYLNQGDLLKSRNLFNNIDQHSQNNPRFWQVRGLLFEKLMMPAHALNDYKELLRLTKDRDDIRLRCVHLAAELGKLTTLKQHLDLLSDNLLMLTDNNMWLMIADAYRKSLAYELALRSYYHVFTNTAYSKELQLRAVLGLAATYRQAGLLYEAEQSLRMALVRTPYSWQVLALLFDLALKSERFADAELWLARLHELDRADKSLQTRIKQAEFLAATGELRHAVKSGHILLRQIIDDNNDLLTGDTDTVPAIITARLALARSLLAIGSYRAARHHCLQLLQDDAEALEPLVLLYKLYELDGYSEKGQVVFLRTLEAADDDLGSLLRLTRLYRQYEQSAAMERVARIARKRAPDSLSANLLLVEALQLNGDHQQAISLLAEIVGQYPTNIKAGVMFARALFEIGRFDQALAQSNIILKQNERRPDIELLKARIFWAQKHREKSQELYSRFLEPSIEQLFTAKSTALGLTLPVAAPVRQKSIFWQTITFDRDQQNDFLDRVMSASYAASAVQPSSEPRFDEPAAALYATYRWHQQFAAEKSAKRFVLRGEYFRAARQYKALLAAYPVADSILFDLAGIYARLNKAEQEAGIYEQLARRNSEFPGLRAAMDRNSLRWRPKLTAGYAFRKAEGRKDYINIKQEKQYLRLWFPPRFTPLLRHEIDLSVARINYRMARGDKNLRSRRGFLEYRTDLSEHLAFTIGVGVEAFANDRSSIALFSSVLSGRFGDKLTATVSFSRDVTDDTIASLRRQIIRQDKSVAVTLAPLPRLSFTGKYLLTDYSDNNQISNYELSTSYVLFKDPTLLKFSYVYSFKDTHDEWSSQGIPLADGFALNDHPYWTPQDYWSNRFSLFFKHQLADDLFGRGVPRYYLAEYSVEYDVGGYAIQTLKGGFFIEWTPNIITDAALSVTASEVYRSKEFFLSVIYRW